MAGIPYPDPTPEQIRQRAAEVRKWWSPGEEVRRRTWGPHNAYRAVGEMDRVIHIEQWGRAIEPVYVQEVHGG